MPEPTAPVDTAVDYRLAPLVTARFVGLGLIGLAVLMFVGTAVVALTGLPPDLLVVLLVLGVVGVFTLGWWLRARAYVVRLRPEGYRVGVIRQPGVREAQWRVVEDVVVSSSRGVPTVVLRLRDGGSTTIPVGVLAIDKDDFVRDLQGYLQHGQGRRKL